MNYSFAGWTSIQFGNLPCAGDTLIEKLEEYLRERGKVGYACVLVTPDDEGHRKGHPEENRPRARQNVVLELGMVLTQLGRSRVAILVQRGVEHPSDIGGLTYIEFENKVTEVTARIFQEVLNAGLNPSPKALS